MKNPDRLEIWLFWSILVIVCLFLSFFLLYFMTTKNEMCMKETSPVVLKRDLDWLECLTL